MLSGAEAAAKKVVETAYDGGQKLTRFAGQKVKERRAAARIKNQVSGMARPGAPTRQAGKRSIKVRQPAVKPKPSAARAVKQGGKGIKGAKQAAASARRSAKTAQHVVQHMQVAAKATAQSIRAAAHAVAAAVKAAITAAQDLGAAIAAGGWVSVVVIRRSLHIREP